MPDSRDSSSKRTVPKLDPVNVMGSVKRPPSAETKPMAKPKAPAPKKDSAPIKSTSGAKPMPTKKRGAASEAKKGS